MLGSVPPHQGTDLNQLSRTETFVGIARTAVPYPVNDPPAGAKIVRGAADCGYRYLVAVRGTV